MSDFTLTIGDKYTSSWSLRPWVLMKHAGIPFTENNIALDKPETRKTLKTKSPSGLVPFLSHDTGSETINVWDSLAIAEHLNDVHPEKKLWPTDPHARAIARAISAEMHSGFSALRTVWPMQFGRKDLAHTTTGGVRRDLERIDALWTRCRKEYGGSGDFLFGAFSIADAMYAPVVSRMVTYGPVPLSPEATSYRDMIIDLPAMKAWGEEARAEFETAG